MKLILELRALQHACGIIVSFNGGRAHARENYQLACWVVRQAELILLA